MKFEQELIEKLKKLAIFTDFSEDEKRLESILDIMKKEKYSAGENIIVEGDFGNKLYVLINGTVKILKKTLQDEAYTVAILSSDDNIFFGEIAIIDNDKRSATVHAESNCDLLYIDRDNFLEFCEKDPYAGYKITMKIAQRISGAIRKMNKDVLMLYQALVDEVEGIL